MSSNGFLHITSFYYYTFNNITPFIFLILKFFPLVKLNFAAYSFITIWTNFFFPGMNYISNNTLAAFPEKKASRASFAWVILNL